MPRSSETALVTSHEVPSLMKKSERGLGKEKPPSGPYVTVTELKVEPLSV